MYVDRYLVFMHVALEQFTCTDLNYVFIHTVFNHFDMLWFITSIGLNHIQWRLNLRLHPCAMECTTSAQIYYHFNANIVHFKCKSSLCVTLSSVSSVGGL